MKILIISLSNLGDAILTYPAIDAVHHKFPQAEFHVVASPNTKELFEGDSRFRKVLLWRKKSIAAQLALIARLIGQRYALVVDFKNTMIPLFLIGAKRTPVLRRTIPEVHRVEQHLALLDAIGVQRIAGATRLPFGMEDAAGLPETPFAVIVPGAKSHLKRWAPAKFAKVADRLAAEQKLQIVLVGGAEDRKEGEAVRRAMTAPALDLCGKTSLRQLAALLSKASLVVTNDTANLHAAQAMMVPTVAIFGPTDEKKYGPRNLNSAVVRKNLICSPCEKALCIYNHECMDWIQPGDVYSAALNVLRPNAK